MQDATIIVVVVAVLVFGILVHMAVIVVAIIFAAWKGSCSAPCRSFLITIRGLLVVV